MKLKLSKQQKKVVEWLNGNDTEETACFVPGVHHATAMGMVKKGLLKTKINEYHNRVYWFDGMQTEVTGNEEWNFTLNMVYFDVIDPENGLNFAWFKWRNNCSSKQKIERSIKSVLKKEIHTNTYWLEWHPHPISKGRIYEWDETQNEFKRTR